MLSNFAKQFYNPLCQLVASVLLAIELSLPSFIDKFDRNIFIGTDFKYHSIWNFNPLVFSAEISSSSSDNVT